MVYLQKIIQHLTPYSVIFLPSLIPQTNLCKRPSKNYPNNGIYWRVDIVHIFECLLIFPASLSGSDSRGFDISFNAFIIFLTLFSYSHVGKGHLKDMLRRRASFPKP